MKRTLAVLTALSLALNTTAEQANCLTVNQSTYYGELGGSAGSQLGEGINLTGNPYLWVKWHGIVERDVLIHSWRISLSGYVYNTGMAIRVNIRDTEQAKIYYQKCDSGYKEVGIEIVVFAAGTTNVISKVSSVRTINPAG